MATLLHIRMLGVLGVVYGTHAVTLGSARLRSLFAWLVLHAGVPQSRAQLAFSLWPDSSEPQARTNLRKALHHLQRVLPNADQFLDLSGSTVSWRADAPYTLDVAEFKTGVRSTPTTADLERLLALYRGDLLPDCYDDWIVAERERLRRVLADLLQRGTSMLEAAHDYATALRYAQRLIEHDPLHEQAYADLMRLHALNGDRTAALRTYQQCAIVLKRELGVEPSKTTRAVYEAICTGRIVTQSPGSPHPPSNLPAPLTLFIGREWEVTAVVDRLQRSDVRLLTLTGTGGTGKTRLALHVATRLRNTYQDGVFWVDLSPIRDADFVLAAIARVLGVVDAGDQPLAAQLALHLGDKRLLLVLDNFEQVIAAGSLITDLLQRAPHVQVLVTSREVLHVYGEHQFHVPLLRVPSPGCMPPYEALVHNEAVHLFIYHAQAAHPLFVFTPKHAPLVVELCRRLDGLPLAIELAGRRSRDLPLQTLVDQIGNRFALLSGGWRDKPERHQTLYATIEWSYHLLNADEQRLFRRLAVFADGCTPEAAEAVCREAEEQGHDVQTLLASLIDKSLLQREQTGDETRYRMLEAIREYAWEQLGRDSMVETVRQRHAEYYLALVEAAEPHLSSVTSNMWFDRLEQEHGNLRAALAWSLEAEDRTMLGLHLGAALVRFWQLRGYVNEGRQWLGKLLANNARLPRSTRARALNDIGWLAICQADYDTAAPLVEESLELWRMLGDNKGIAVALNNLGSIAMYQGKLDRAHTLFQESLVLRRELGDTAGVASALNNLGNVALDQADYAGAKTFHEESLALRRELGDKWFIAVSLNNLALIAMDERDYRRTTALLEESLHLFRYLGDNNGAAFALGNLGFAALYQDSYERAAVLFAESLSLFRATEDKEGIAYSLEGLAGLAAAQSEPQRAAQLWSVAQAIRDAIGAPLPLADQVTYARFQRLAQAQLDEIAWHAAWEEGRTMSLEQAVAYALSDTRNMRSSSRT